MATTARNLDLGNLVASIEADISPLQKGIAQADKSVASFGKSFTKVAAGAAATVAVLGTAIAYQMGKLSHSANQAIDSQAKLADAIGTNIQLIQGLQFSAPISGVSTQNIEKGLSQIAKFSGEAAAGTERASTVLKALSLDASKFSNLKLQDQFYLIADSLSAVKNSTDRVILAQKIFGDEVAVKLLPLLMQGTQALKAQAAQAEKFGLVTSRIDAKTIETFNDELTIVGMRFDGLFRQLSTQMTPVLLKMARQVLGFADSLGTAKEQSESLFFGFASSAGTIIDALESMKLSAQIVFKGLQVSGLSAAGAIAKSYEFVVNSINGYFNSVDMILAEQERKIARFFSSLAAETKALADNTQSIPFLSGSLENVTESLNKFAESYAEAANQKQMSKYVIPDSIGDRFFDEAVQAQDEIAALQESLLTLGATSDKWGNAITQYFKQAQIEARLASEAALELQKSITGGDGTDSASTIPSKLAEMESISKSIELQAQLRQQAEGIISSYETQAEKLQIVKDRLMELYKLGVVTNAEMIETIKRIDEQMPKTGMDKLAKDFNDAWKDSIKSVGDELKKMVKEGEFSLSRLKDKLLDTFTSKIIDSTIDFGINMLLGGIPGYASGGYPSPNNLYMAGENGPELIAPAGKAHRVFNANDTEKWLQRNELNPVDVFKADRTMQSIESANNNHFEMPINVVIQGNADGTTTERLIQQLQEIVPAIMIDQQRRGMA